MAFILAGLYRIFKPRIKGALGERKIALRLNGLSRYKYKVINNLVLEVNGRTSQIDHVVISDFGVFVIETKNVKGWIVGNEHSEYWMQVIYKRKEKLYNPLRQNQAHIAALKHHLYNFPNITYVPIVVFSNRSAIKVETDAFVIYSSQLTSVIKQSSETRLSQAEKETIFAKLTAVNLSGTYDRATHIKGIRKRIKERDKSIQHGKCPQCGGALTARQGRFGRFFGCSNYPQCKFTVNQ